MTIYPVDFLSEQKWARRASCASEAQCTLLMPIRAAERTGSFSARRLAIASLRLWDCELVYSALSVMYITERWGAHLYLYVLGR
jgi:hypothetical protein